MHYLKQAISLTYQFYYFTYNQTLYKNQALITLWVTFKDFFMFSTTFHT